MRLLSIVATLLLLPAIAAASATPRRYSGRTSEDTAITLRLSPDARRVAVLEIHYRVTCNDGVARPTTFTDVLNIAIRHRRFAAHGVYIGSRDHSRNHYTLSGAISRRTVDGGFRLTASGTAGKRTVRCDSGPVLWAARPAR